jgi:hypothetical protein
MHFIRRQTANATPIVDPLREQLVACGQRATGESRHDLPMFFDLPGVFPASLARNAEFVYALSGAYDLIARRGPLAAVEMSATSGEA